MHSSCSRRAAAAVLIFQFELRLYMHARGFIYCGLAAHPITSLLGARTHANPPFRMQMHTQITGTYYAEIVQTQNPSEFEDVNQACKTRAPALFYSDAVVLRWSCLPFRTGARDCARGEIGLSTHANIKCMEINHSWCFLCAGLKSNQVWLRN